MSENSEEKGDFVAPVRMRTRLSQVRSIRIYHEYEGGIEKYFPRITDWHHEACRVMTIGDRKGRIF